MRCDGGGVREKGGGMKEKGGGRREEGRSWGSEPVWIYRSGSVENISFPDLAK